MKQINVANSMLIGQKAPNFIASAYGNLIRYPEDFSGKWVVLFNLPKDLTPSIIQESNGLTLILDEFENMNTALVGFCIDSIYKYIYCFDSYKQLDGRMKRYADYLPIVEDVDKSIAREFFLISEEKAIESVVIIDSNGIIRSQLNYENPTWGKLFEIKNIIQALQYSDLESTREEDGN
ncbi:redoxin domain-containing protein [Sinanaerobacter chloroacetimidivorans]|uniref:Redoxin domain-containing protein n=1 Tax=Sinanaerobacter chloroacetimidivorans TaxID=2818044 RepID=A0A8J7W3I9_9FIRM|nr:redoxin domain-containing protein [Sinanaerobacter chloroacetimidivorans]MBR0598503.1 redoxin domain-containing protein [Sinanaerobacter chloroacetimidivorans]